MTTRTFSQRYSGAEERPVEISISLCKNIPTKK
jgi:hypothetical protein